MLNTDNEPSSVFTIAAKLSSGERSTAVERLGLANNATGGGSGKSSHAHWLLQT
jgi:hypothetical protein